jgi:hypothetical protein
LKSGRAYQLTKKIVLRRVSTPAGGWSASQRSTVGASMWWLPVTSSTLFCWSLYCCWSAVSGAGWASLESVEKKRSS